MTCFGLSQPVFSFFAELTSRYINE